MRTRCCIPGRTSDEHPKPAWSEFPPPGASKANNVKATAHWKAPGSNGSTRLDVCKMEDGAECIKRCSPYLSLVFFSEITSNTPCKAIHMRLEVDRSIRHRSMTPGRVARMWRTGVHRKGSCRNGPNQPIHAPGLGWNRAADRFTVIICATGETGFKWLENLIHPLNQENDGPAGSGVEMEEKTDDGQW